LRLAQQHVARAERLVNEQANRLFATEACGQATAAPEKPPGCFEPSLRLMESALMAGERGPAPKKLRVCEVLPSQFSEKTLLGPREAAGARPRTLATGRAPGSTVPQR